MSQVQRMLMPACIVGTTLIGSVVGGWAPTDAHRVAAIFPPWWSTEAVIAAASRAGNVEVGGGLGFVVALSSDQDDLPEAVRAAGAILVLDRTKAGLCLPDKER